MLIYQLKQAFLSLQKSKGFVASVIITIGITLGALICASSLAYIMFIKPLPYPEQERLINVEHQLIDHNGNVDGRAFTYPNLMYLYQQQTIFEQSALIYRDGAVLTSVASEPMLPVSYVNPEWFEMLNATTAIGRGFESSEQIDQFNPVAVISYQLWQETFDGTPDVLSKSLTFADKSFQIIGVLSESFVEPQIAGPGFDTQVYIPWDYNSVVEEERNAWGNDDSGLSFIGKLKAPLTAIQVSEALATLVNSNWQAQVAERQFFNNWRIGIEATKLQDYIISDSAQNVILLVIGSLGLVIIACTNIANLFIARTAQRQKLLATMAAVGASRRQLFGGMVAETGIMMVFAVLLAQGIAIAGFNTIEHYLADELPRIDELGINGFFISISLVLATVLTLIFSWLTLRMVNYRVLSASLQSSGKGNGVQVSKRVRNLLISCQIAIATLLVFINLLLFQDAINMVNQPLGYETDNRYAMVLAFPSSEQRLNEDQLTQLKKALHASPKITDVSQAMRPTLFSTRAITVAETQQRLTARGKDIDHHYFQLVNQRLIAGRNFTEEDIQNRERVVVVNEVLAQQLAPNGEAIGVTFTNGAKVIGVVETITVPGQRYTEGRFYYPASLSRNMLLVKVAEHQKLSREEVVTIFKNVDQQLKLFSFSSLTDNKNARLFSSISTAYTTLVLVILTFALSALGLYGILHFATQMRRAEIGTRMSIGAKGSDIIRLIIKDNAIAILTGLGISIVVLGAGYLVFNSLLNDLVSKGVLLSFIVTLMLISMVAFCACYLPLRQYIYQPVVKSLRGSQ